MPGNGDLNMTWCSMIAMSIMELEVVMLIPSKIIDLVVSMLIQSLKSSIVEKSWA